MATSKEQVKRVQDLVRLATDDEAAEEERRTAALTAVRLMQSEGLTVIADRDVEAMAKSVEGMRAELANVKKAGTKQMVLGALGGFVMAKTLAKNVKLLG